MDQRPFNDVEAGPLIALLHQLNVAVLRVEGDSLNVSPVGSAGEALLAALPDPRGFFGAAVPEDDRPRVLEAVRAVQAGTGPRTVEHRVRLGDRERVFRTAFHAEKDSVLAALLDITAAHHDQQQWHETETWLMTLGEALPFDFWICDREGRCTLQNPASLRRWGNRLGLTAAEALEPAASREHWRRSFGRALGGEVLREELRYEVDGTLHTFTRVLAPARDGDEVRGVLGLDIDITELKQTEERLRESLVELSAAQQSLVRKQQLTALGEMSAVVAHEVRNPLGSISNALVLLRRGAQLDARGSALCDIIDDEVRRLDQLVVSLLEFSRPMSAELSPRSVMPVLEQALLQTLRADPKHQRIRVVRQVDETLGPVPMDTRLLNMALTNLLRNAVQAMGGDGELHITVDRDTPQWARLSIRDSGPGIPAVVQERMFQPFVTTRPTGSGLGLTIVRRAIEAHRGRLDFDSAPGGGTTFVIRLPVRAER